MWSHILRTGHRYATRYPLRNGLVVPFRRNYNYGPAQTTYFSPPPPPPPRRSSRGWRFVRAIVYTGTGFVTSLYCLYRLSTHPDVGNSHREIKGIALQGMLALPALPMDQNSVQSILKSRSHSMASQNATTHFSQLPSNLPCEDFYGFETGVRDQAKDWTCWAIYDGHAGPQTAKFLAEALPSAVFSVLADTHCLTRPYTPNDAHIIHTIRNAFLKVDRELVVQAAYKIESAIPLAEKLHHVALASAGSCALFAMYDPVHSVLRVANVGDSRAVLGRWDNESHQYVAKPMSMDHTGFNSDELARIKANHPAEDVVDSRTGRVHGIAVSRAFGDARWKWSEETSRKIHDLVWGPSPRPNNAIKTPPYLTAEPEIMETQVQKGEHPDFLIMASDGLWDNVSSDDAVAAVQMWLQKYKPSQIAEERVSFPIWLLGQAVPGLLATAGVPLPSPASDRIGDPQDDTYYDEKDKTLRWRVSPKHFSVEDENCGAHLIRNALGGSRQDLLYGVMTIQPPLSRNVRDDITVQVIFFGDEYRSK